MSIKIIGTGSVIPKIKESNSSFINNSFYDTNGDKIKLNNGVVGILRKRDGIVLSDIHGEKYFFVSSLRAESVYVIKINDQFNKILEEQLKLVPDEVYDEPTGKGLHLSLIHI